ncbi:MAG TPA: hypothetical protein PKL92_05385 [Aquaticitalea sp.]|nr:hypothetical protein [Aquaticitalea sp.]HNU59013.1 hypothetical protein [Aquaticitalea sp.]
MKKYTILLFIVILAYGCKNDKNDQPAIEESVQTEANAIKLMSGSFTYYADAAVFQTNNELYGVIENDQLTDLVVQAETLKEAPTDEVKVTLKVKVSKKPELEEGWENRIEIIEIVNVTKSNPKDNSIITLGNNNSNAENQ